MRKAALFFAIMMVFTLFGCGGKQDGSGESTDGKESKYAESLEVLDAVVKAYAEEDLFSIYGGNQENAVMDAPGKFDISKTEELAYTLGLPESQFSSIDDAASMVHMMNANTFTGAVYRLKDGTDMDAFADAVESGILSKQWVCGQPDTFIVINVDGKYVITAYGEAGIIETFKNNALSALDGAKVITETPVS